LLFDALLAEAAIAVKQINGYRHEEFTHSAVAAEVAYGSADVGFGTGSAARCYALEFLPLAEEVYSLAWNQFWQDDERLQTFLAFLSEFITLRLAGKESYEGQLIQSKPLTARVFLAQFIDG
jgi:molybdate-binding protein